MSDSERRELDGDTGMRRCKAGAIDSAPSPALRGVGAELSALTARGSILAAALSPTRMCLTCEEVAYEQTRCIRDT